MSDSIGMFVTINEIENPALFKKLQAIHNCKARSRMLKQLASLGISFDGSSMTIDTTIPIGLTPSTIVSETAKTVPRNPDAKEHGLDDDQKIPPLTMDLASLGFQIDY